MGRPGGVFVRCLIAVILLSSMAASAQEDVSPPPVVPVQPQALAPEAPPVSDESIDATYWQRCFAVPAQVWVPMPTGRYLMVSGLRAQQPLSTFHAAAPVGTAPAVTTPSGGGDAAPGGGAPGNVGDGKALLFIAVVLVAALPIVLYVFDEDAPAVVEQRFHCPTFSFDAVGGVDLRAAGTFGAGSGRFTFGYSYFGADVQFDLSAGSVTSWVAHLMLRIGPKKHIAPNLAFGYRSMTLDGVTRSGLEVGVPHRYVLWREGLREFSLELRPTLMFGLGAFDLGLEAAAIFPIVEPIHVRLGGRVQSFGDEVFAGLNAGLNFTF